MTERRNYDDIIDLPRHVSATRPRMPMADRAAQFSPFQALTGYGDAVAEAGRLTEERIELCESRMEELNEALIRIRRALEQGERPALRMTCFVPDARKDGGAYVTVEDRAIRLDALKQRLHLAGGGTAAFGDILNIEFPDGS